VHDPLVQWFSQSFQVPPPTVTEALVNIQHTEETLTSIQWLLFHVDDHTLAGLDSAAHNAKSLVIACAMWKNYITLNQAIEASRTEEDYQLKFWREIRGPGGHDVDRLTMSARLSAAYLYLHAVPEKPAKK
jgi:chaperone required for assembly of F1-ATPase